MAKTTDQKALAPLFIFFMLVNAFCLFFKDWLDSKNIDHFVVGIGNCILFFLSVVIYFMQKKSLQNTNPNVFVRSIMAGTFIKLIVIAGAVVIYLLAAGENKSNYGIIAAVSLYFVYTFIEVKTAARLNKEYGSH
ncbi:MAG TPA: hypothetical protein PLA68_13810 [Panacibacter sp.]|nr:hypothetical protein [Panacibacter sp.]